MPLYKKVKNDLKPIKEENIPVEHDIQKVTEFNLGEVFGLQYISSEFSLNNLRIDTLAFDRENRTFVIIEYKKDRSFSVIDQGFSYLALMLNNKAEFLVEYNEKIRRPLRREDINWSQSRVIFISPFFTPHQRAAINFKNLPIELWEIKFYDDNLIEYKEIEPLEISEKIETITGSKFIKEVTKEIKTYDLDTHLKRGSEKTRKIFHLLREKIFDLGEVTEKYLQFYVGYHIGDRKFNFAVVHFYKEKLEVFILLPKDKLDDPKRWARTVPRSWGWAKNLKLFTIKSEKDISYAMELIRQSYEFNRNR